MLTVFVCSVAPSCTPILWVVGARSDRLVPKTYGSRTGSSQKRSAPQKVLLCGEEIQPGKGPLSAAHGVRGTLALIWRLRRLTERYRLGHVAEGGEETCASAHV